MHLQETSTRRWLTTLQQPVKVNVTGTHGKNLARHVALQNETC